jgi:hypothetical protein
MGATGPTLAQDHSLVTYAAIAAPQYIDVAPSGLSIGDQYMRRGDIMFAADGPAVGEYYSQATIVFLDTAAGKSARSFVSETILPDGTIYKLDLVQTSHGKPMTEGHKHEGAIIGGTGKYSGIRGSYILELMPSGKVTKTTYSYWLGQ